MKIIVEQFPDKMLEGEEVHQSINLNKNFNQIILNKFISNYNRINNLIMIIKIQIRFRTVILNSKIV